MKYWFLFVLSICFLQVSHAQQLVEEAVYYDNLGNPFKIDRKYTNDTIEKFVSHYNNGSICIQRQNEKKGDTTIITESYFSIYGKRGHKDHQFAKQNDHLI